MTDSNPTKDAVAAWLRDSHLLNRTGVGAAVAALGLATATAPSDAAFGIAALLALTGMVIRFWSAGVISKNRELATTGPYALVRNPLYTGSMLVAVGFLFLNGNPWFIIPAIIAAVVLYMRTIESEEADLLEIFGADFERYREQVPAIIPWKGYCDTGAGGETSYSLEQSLFNKEFNGVYGTMGMLALFYMYAHWIPETPFRVGTTLLVIVLMAVRGTRRGAKERAIAAQAAQAAQASMTQETAEASVETPLVTPVVTTEPLASAAVAPVAPVEEVPEEVAVEVAVEVVEAAPVLETADETPEPVAVAEVASETLAEVVAEELADIPVSGVADAAAEATDTDEVLASPLEFDEDALLKESLAEQDESSPVAPPVTDEELDHRALLDAIDADEVAEALGALEQLDAPFEPKKSRQSGG